MGLLSGENAWATEYGVGATILSNLPSADEPKVQEDIKAAKANETRMRDEPGQEGMKQLAERTHEQEHERDHTLHLYHPFERVVGALQIAIVLASVSVVTRGRTLAVG